MLTNHQPSEVKLTLEPWADEHLIASGGRVEIEFSGPSGGRIEVELRPGAIVVYGWQGAIMSVETSSIDPANPSV